MDRQGKSNNTAKYTKWGVIAILLTGVVFAFRLGMHHGAGAKAKPGLWATYMAAFDTTEDKVAEIQRAMEENERLRYENANLRLKLETAQFDCHEKQAATDTRKIGAKVADEAGSRVARTLASISYKPPGNLLPNQLYTLGVTYFKAHENEKAAVIFSFLTQMEDNTAYQTSRNYLMAGVAWYRVDNFDLAGLYFDKALKEPDSDENLQFQAQARLWKSLVAQHQNKESDAQHWLRELVDHHPHSLEASWVNGTSSTEKKREPATSEE